MTLFLTEGLKQPSVLSTRFYFTQTNRKCLFIERIYNE